METKTYNLGSIELDNKVYISDPCYGFDTWCQKVLDNVKSGTYLGFVNKVPSDWGSGLRVSDIYVLHKDYLNYYPDSEVPDVSIGVDSGQAGIYDGDYYEKYHTSKDECNHVDRDWYDRVCEGTIDYDIDGNRMKTPDYHYDSESGQFIREEVTQELRQFIKLDDRCIVSSSGYGDGCYPLYICTNLEGEVVGMRVNFINDEDEDEDDEYYEDEEEDEEYDEVD